MPYMIQHHKDGDMPKGGRYCVHRKGDDDMPMGEAMACHGMISRLPLTPDG